MRNGLFGLIGCAMLLGGCGQATEAAGKKFDEKFRSSCVSSAVESGAPPPLAVRTCTCAIDEINKKYSVTEKMTLSDEQAMAIVIPCAKKAVQQ